VEGAVLRTSAGSVTRALPTERALQRGPIVTNLKRLAVPFLFAAMLLSIPLVNTIAWSSSCGTSSTRVCVFADSGFVDPKAGISGSVSLYTGKYFNTNIDINDSGNGNQNWYTNQAVVFHDDANNTGGSFCVNPLIGYSNVGWTRQDRWSSHLVGETGSRC
jgi:hypothetical protein